LATLVLTRRESTLEDGSKKFKASGNPMDDAGISRNDSPQPFNVSKVKERIIVIMIIQVQSCKFMYKERYIRMHTEY